MTEDPRLGLPSASAFEIVAECNGQQQLLKTLPTEALQAHKEAPDPLRDSGIRIHRARETGSTLELNPEEYQLYKAGLDYEQRILDKWKDTFSLAEVTEGKQELRLWLHDAALNPLCSGQLDVHYISGKRALIIDWKTGFLSNLVGARGNWQLRLQALLLKEDHEELEEIRVAFAKPMFEKSALDYCDYTDIDLKHSLDATLYVLWWSTQPDAPRRAGRHCLHCPAKAHCPESLAFAMLPSTMVKMSKVGRKREIATHEVLPEDLYKLWQFKGAITAILEAVVDRLKTFTDEDLAKIGLMRGKPRQGAFFKDLKGACMFLTEEKALFAPEQVWEHMDLALGPLASIYALRTGNTEDASKEYLKNILAPYMGLKEGERSIVRLK